jgi:hypothetical protein
MAAQSASAVAITGGTITGITDLTVADGGTGASTLSANAVLLGNGTSALQTVAPSTSGNVLTSNGTTWTSAALNFDKSLTANGWQKLPSGLIMQWGSASDDNANQNFPIEFPNACFSITATTYPVGSYSTSLSVSIIDRTAFKLRLGEFGGNTAYWFAIGY